MHNHSSHMTSCDNHKTSTSFTSAKMKERRKEENKTKTSDLSFLQKLGQRPCFAEIKTSWKYISNFMDFEIFFKDQLYDITRLIFFNDQLFFILFYIGVDLSWVPLSWVLIQNNYFGKKSISSSITSKQLYKVSKISTLAHNW